jgi:hypothetical protein
MEASYEGLCALVNKNGVCYQCKELRDLAPEAKRGRPCRLSGPMANLLRSDFVTGCASSAMLVLRAARADRCTISSSAASTLRNKHPLRVSELRACPLPLV